MPDDTTPKADQFRYYLVCEDISFERTGSGPGNSEITVLIKTCVPPEMLERGFVADIVGREFFFEFRGTLRGRLIFATTRRDTFRYLSGAAGKPFVAELYSTHDLANDKPMPARVMPADIPVPAAKPTLVRGGFGFVQVCVPAGWSDAEVVDFTMREVPREEGFVWQIRRADDAAPNCCPERMPCARHPGFVHIILDA